MERFTIQKSCESLWMVWLLPGVMAIFLQWKENRYPCICSLFIGLTHWNPKSKINHPLQFGCSINALGRIDIIMITGFYIALGISLSPFYSWGGEGTREKLAALGHPTSQKLNKAFMIPNPMSHAWGYTASQAVFHLCRMSSKTEISNLWPVLDPTCGCEALMGLLLSALPMPPAHPLWPEVDHSGPQPENVCSPLL